MTENAGPLVYFIVAAAAEEKQIGALDSTVSGKRLDKMDFELFIGAARITA